MLARYWIERLSLLSRSANSAGNGVGFGECALVAVRTGSHDPVKSENIADVPGGIGR